MKFRLQKVLEVREILEKESQRIFSKSMRRLQVEQQELRQLVDKKNSFVKKVNQSDRLEAHLVVDQHSYLSALQDRIKDRSRRIEVIAKEVEDHRQNLLKTMQGKKSIERLKEKAELDALKSHTDKEQFQVDEIARRIKDITEDNLL